MTAAAVHVDAVVVTGLQREATFVPNVTW